MTMLPTTTEERSKREQSRRRAFQERTPEHYCPECLTVAYVDDEACFTCEFARPRTGWPSVVDSGDPWLGRIIEDRYLITRRIARGAKSRVYQADSRIIPRSFAIKVMDVTEGPDLDQEGLRKRLRKEVAELSTLRNPHVVGFYDVFDIDDRYIAFVMDLVRGVSLDDLVGESGALSVRRTLAIARQLANGLYEAHQAGLIHRDVKPTNVMIETLPAGDDFVHILDFGVVWVRGTVEQTGAFDLSPVFSSPELVAGEAFDQRTDIYSIGALLFYMLTGKPPFSGDSIVETVDTLRSESAPTLAETAGRTFPEPLEELVASLLEKDPADRPTEASEVIEWLDEVTEVVLGPPTGEIEADLPPPGDTAMGMIPTIDRLRPSTLSDVSVEMEEAPPMACRGRGYAFIRGPEVVWAGDWDDLAPGRIPAEAEVTAIDATAGFAVLGTSEGKILRVEPGEDATVSHESSDGGAITSVAATADGRFMIAGSATGCTLMSRDDEWVPMGEGKAISAVELNDRGDQFAIARDDDIQVMSLHASNLSSFPTPVDDRVIAMAFSADDYLLAILTDRGTVLLESVHTGQEFMRFETGDTGPRALTFSSDGQLTGLFWEDEKLILRALT